MLDFTSRVLPHLRMSVPPKLINFLPYNVQQLAVILAARIKDGGSCRRGGTAIIDSRAVQYCARKVAAVHGDVRRALDICRYVGWLNVIGGDSVTTPYHVCTSAYKTILCTLDTLEECDGFQGEKGKGGVVALILH